jgi:chromosome partitioning protein
MAGRASRQRSGHIIVFGNEKGGSGKSTTAMHVLVALLKAGRSVASIDTDGRQRSLTRYIENRGLWRQRTGLPLEMPTHFTVPPGEGESVSDIEGREFRAFAEAISRVEHRFEFIVVDTPGSNSYLMRVSHAMADTLITPINESFVDFDVLARVDPATQAMLGPSHYAELVAEARRQRGLVESEPMNWVVVRNRLTSLDTRNRKNIARGLDRIAGQLDFRIVEGISERVVFREFFLHGLTALDTLNQQTLGNEPTMSHLAARREIGALVAALNLPVREQRETGADGEAPVRHVAPADSRTDSAAGTLRTGPG